MGGSTQWEVSGEASGKWVRARVLSSFMKGTRQLQRCQLALHPTQGAQKTHNKGEGIAIIAHTPWHFMRTELVILGSDHPEKHGGYSRQDLEQAFRSSAPSSSGDQHSVKLVRKPRGLAGPLG